MKQLYRELFETRDLISANRERYELVWGFGVLQWEPTERVDVRYPLLTIPVEIAVDAATQRLTVMPSGAVTVESQCLLQLALHDQQSYSSIRQSFDSIDDPLDPWNESATRDLLRRLVRAIDDEGVIAGEGDATAGTAVVDPGWVLFVRRRRPDYQGFLDDLRQIYREGVMPPEPLRSVVIDAPSTLAGDDSADGSSARDQQRFLLPLPANDEQLRILRKISYQPGVTVQGPPGTGKSHTIANLISHYVAQGKKVLVVAEKEQALKSLIEKIPEEISDLAVAVLGADEEGRRRLEASIRTIQSTVSALDKHDADREIAQLKRELDQTDRDLATAVGALCASDGVVLNGSYEFGDNPRPLEAARWVAQHEGELGVITDPIALDTACPLKNGELAEVCQLIVAIGIDRATTSGLALPEAARLTAPERLTELLEILHRRDAEQAAAKEVYDWDKVNAASPEAFGTLRGSAQAVRQLLASTQGSWLESVSAELRDQLFATEWTQFVAVVRDERQRLFDLRSQLVAHIVDVPDTADPALRLELRNACTKLSQRGKLGRFDKAARAALKQCSVNGHPAATAADGSLCLLALDATEIRHTLATRWNNQMRRVAGPQLDAGSVEDHCGEVVDAIDQMRNLAATWNHLARDASHAGVTVSGPPSIETCDRVLNVLEVIDRKEDSDRIASELDTLRAYLEDGAQASGASPLWALLGDALANENVTEWAEHRTTVVDLAQHEPGARRLRELLDRLSVTAPAFAGRVVSDSDRDRYVDIFERAWQWRQDDGWLEGVHAVDSVALQRKIAQLGEERRRAVSLLVARMAWRRMIDNLGDSERQALNSYMQAVKRFGKTGGKFAQRWLTEMRRAMDDAKHAVPVWIMPTHRALSNFRPGVQVPFDVLVIDEASQIGLDALPIFSLARAAVVVGDDKQTSPENVGLERNSVFEMIDSHLHMIPSHRTLFDPDASLYDLSSQKFPDVVVLREHFRCLPDIIEFSNRHVYQGAIVPLRERPPAPGWEPLHAVKVDDGYRSGYLNEPEADAVVDLVEKLAGDPAYDGMDFGVISLLATAQSEAIRRKLFERVGPRVMQERNIRVGEAANFQGDERDVTILSLVVATDPANPTGRIGAMTGLSAERRINVAASRAKNQMWIVHSVEPDRFPTGDLRAELIRHCRSGRDLAEQVQDLESRCESEFERDVVRRILARGYRRVQVQHRVGRFRLDIVVEGLESRLAVECDGDRWHDDDRWHQDRARQEVLERAGWTFERIRGSAFYRNPDVALQPLWDRLDALGISPNDAA